MNDKPLSEKAWLNVDENDRNYIEKDVAEAIKEMILGLIKDKQTLIRNFQQDDNNISQIKHGDYAIQELEDLKEEILTKINGDFDNHIEAEKRYEDTDNPIGLSSTLLSASQICEYDEKEKN